MKLHELKPRPGAKKNRKRVGRGISAGQGKTAGRGTKGLGARAGAGGHIYRQGGNLPFFRRLPFKRGFTNVNRAEWNEINLDQLDRFKADQEVAPEQLAEAGPDRRPGSPGRLARPRQSRQGAQAARSPRFGRRSQEDRSRRRFGGPDQGLRARESGRVFRMKRSDLAVPVHL